MVPNPVVSDKKCNINVLQDILCRYWNKQIEITKADTEQATVKGNNFVSDAWRIRFEYHEVGKKETQSYCVIVKSRPTDESLNRLMHTDIAFQNEIHAYEKVIPTLNRYVHSPLRVPGYIHGDSTSIVLEDMCKRSFHNINKKLASEWNQVWSPIQEMAKLHAASIIMQKEDQNCFDEIVSGITEVPFDETTPLGEKQASALETISQFLQELQTPDAIKYKEVLESVKAGAWKAQKNIINEKMPIRVINHGSIWINNLMYRNDMITLLDWQHIVFSSPATDLCYFLYVNLDTDFLANKKKKLLQLYIMSLHQCIYDLRANKWSVTEVEQVLKQLDFNWIDAEVRRCSLYGYMMAQWITPVYYWSEAVFQQLEKIGGIENLSVKDRLMYMTSDQKDRVTKLTKLYLNESSKH